MLEKFPFASCIPVQLLGTCLEGLAKLTHFICLKGLICKIRYVGISNRLGIQAA